MQDLHSVHLNSPLTSTSKEMYVLDSATLPGGLLLHDKATSDLAGGAGGIVAAGAGAVEDLVSRLWVLAVVAVGVNSSLHHRRHHL